jgi:hypothetical protein
VLATSKVDDWRASAPPTDPAVIARTTTVTVFSALPPLGVVLTMYESMR